MVLFFGKKNSKEDMTMSDYDNNFTNERDLIEHLNRGYKVEFLYDNKKCSITHTDSGISIIEFNDENSEKTYANGRQAMEYKIGKKIKGYNFRNENY